jgi:hypothetical protein
MSSTSHSAVLDNYGHYTTFSFDGTTITFLTGRNLVRYLSVDEWDAGYIVVTCLNRDGSQVEDYIDLVPILENLYIDPDEFLRPITDVRIARGRI